MKLITAICIAACALCQSALACSWIPMPFCETSNARPDDVVLSGRIVNVDIDGIDVEVIDVLRGVENRDTIRIWDGTDFDCTGLFSMAASDLGGLDDSIIVILPWIGSIENTWDVVGDYRRPDYFGYVPDLRISDGMVLGLISGSPSTPNSEMPYADLLTHWNESANGCLGLSVDGLDEVQPFTVHLVNSTLNLTVPGNMALRSTVSIYATSGQEMTAFNAVPGTMWIDLSGYATGVYHIVLVREDGTRSSARVMKV